MLRTTPSQKKALSRHHRTTKQFRRWSKIQTDAAFSKKICLKASIKCQRGSFGCEIASSRPVARESCTGPVSCVERGPRTARWLPFSFFFVFFLVFLFLFRTFCFRFFSCFFLSVFFRVLISTYANFVYAQMQILYTRIQSLYTHMQTLYTCIFFGFYTYIL